MLRFYFRFATSLTTLSDYFQYPHLPIKWGRDTQVSQESDFKKCRNNPLTLVFVLRSFSTCLPKPTQTNTWLLSASVCLWGATAGRWDAGLTQELDQSNLVRPGMNRWNSRSGPIHAALCSNGRLEPGLGDAAAHGAIYKRKKNVEQWEKNTKLFI